MNTKTLPICKSVCDDVIIRAGVRFKHDKTYKQTIYDYAIYSDDYKTIYSSGLSWSLERTIKSFKKWHEKVSKSC